MSIVNPDVCRVRSIARKFFKFFSELYTSQIWLRKYLLSLCLYSTLQPQELFLGRKNTGEAFYVYGSVHR